MKVSWESPTTQNELARIAFALPEGVAGTRLTARRFATSVEIESESQQLLTQFANEVHFRRSSRWRKAIRIDGSSALTEESSIAKLVEIAIANRQAEG